MEECQEFEALQKALPKYFSMCPLFTAENKAEFQCLSDFRSSYYTSTEVAWPIEKLLNSKVVEQNRSDYSPGSRASRSETEDRRMPSRQPPKGNFGEIITRRSILAPPRADVGI